MAFDWEKYESGGGNYITAAEKSAMAEAGAVFTITAIRRTKKFEGEHYELAILVDLDGGGEVERTLSFTIGSGAESRDRLLAGLSEYLDSPDGDDVRATIYKVGRPYLIRKAA